METQDYSRTVQRLLDAADREFDAGEVRLGSMLIWDAVQTSLTAVAKKYGMPHHSLDDIKEVVRFLDRRHTEYPIYLAKFNVADGFRENGECPRWENFEIKIRRKSVGEFIDMLAEREHGI